MIIVADQHDDEGVWRKARRRYLTASDIFKFLPGEELLKRGWWVESWMAKDSDGAVHNMNWVRRDIWNRKETGRELVFGSPEKVLWGQAEEDHCIKRFSEYSGVYTKPTHALVSSERWPYLGASLDAFVLRSRSWGGLTRPEMFVRPSQVVEAIEGLEEGRERLLEMKTTSDFGVTHWVKGKRSEPRGKIIAGAFSPQPPSPPVYYRAQALTQMAMTGIKQCIMVVKGGMSTMTAHTINYDPTWEKVLDRLNDEVKETIIEIREKIDAEE